jgi:2-methylisoborneol synthase
VQRVNDPLAEEVNRRLVIWAEDCGFSDEEVAMLGDTGFGRLVMLTHADCDDPDLYSDDTELGATAQELPPRLAMAAMDLGAPAGESSAQLDEAMRADRVLVALTSGVDHLTRHGTPAQVQRACYGTAAMFVSWNAYGAWRHTGIYPPAWEYLAARQHDSFYTSITLVDVVGGYELDSNVYYEPKVRRLLRQAGTAAVLVNDLFSGDKGRRGRESGVQHGVADSG